ncbi:MAG: DUF971 domain-containing protein [Acidobacteriota bacterium]|nr:DUF971 domain-containing protein [Acidobacteriota bacterium]
MIEPLQIIEESDSELTIVWSDETERIYNAPGLRRACPCASCIDEWTGAKRLKDESVSDDLTIKNVAVVGRYALNFRFSDGHETGIYSFKYLKEMGN